MTRWKRPLRLRARLRRSYQIIRAAFDQWCWPFLRTLEGRGLLAHVRRRPHRVLLGVESLEPRQLLTTFSGVEGTMFTPTFNFTDPTGNPNGTDQYTASINWGGASVSSQGPSVVVSGSAIQVT